MEAHSKKPLFKFSKSFLHSRWFYVSLLIAFTGAEIDWVITAIGLVAGYTETRPFFWLHAVGLFGVIIITYMFCYELRPRFTRYQCLIFAVASPAIPIISNTLVLVTGSSPFF